MTDNFRFGRSDIGDSLGNFRWIDASENGGRGKGAYIPIENDGDLVPNPDAWNEIIPQDANNQPWSRQDIAESQRLIDLRTIYLYEKLLTKSGIESILPPVQAT